MPNPWCSMVFHGKPIWFHGKSMGQHVFFFLLLLYGSTLIFLSIILMRDIIIFINIVISMATEVMFSVVLVCLSVGL